MVYESLSSIVVLVIAVILVLGWLPFRTVKGMKRASEHRQDRLSTSLHMVGREDGMRFCDRQSRTVKGLVMQQGQQDGNRRSQAQRIKQIRQLRRAAIRRRRILVLALLVVTLLVAGCSFLMDYSPWFTLIPLALVVVVLVAGAHASAQARAWERNLAQRRARQRRQQAAILTKSRTPSKPKNEGGTETATDVLDQGEIRQTLAQAKADQQAALKARQHNSSKPAKSAVSSSKAKSSAGSAKSSEKTAAQTAHTSNEPSATKKASERTPVKQTASRPGASKPATTKSSRAQKAASKPAAPKSSVDKSAASPQSASVQSVATQSGKSGSASASAGKEHSASSAQSSASGGSSSSAKAQDDATNELKRINPSPALDAFGMAAGQDLISFSLGSAHDEGTDGDGRNSEDEGPHSLEIKSTRQVSVARPPVKKQADQKKADKRPDDFHKQEMQAQVEVPDRSEDSLSIGVEAILARRRPAAKS